MYYLTKNKTKINANVIITKNSNKNKRNSLLFLNILLFFFAKVIKYIFSYNHKLMLMLRA